MYQEISKQETIDLSNRYIECVIVSINYSDILAYTLPNNKQFFNKTVVVTDSQDKATKRLCDIYNVECIQTDVFYLNKNKIDKGAGINEGLKYLTKQGFVLQLDADCWVHPQSFNNLKKLTLNPQCLYGCDRIMIESFKDWCEFIQMPDIFKDNWLLQLDKYKIGSRISFSHNNDLWQVLGFWQLWNPKVSNIYNYPSYKDVSQSDLIFSNYWHRTRRVFLPEVIVVHLEQGESQTGKNWLGRSNQNFKI